MRPFLEAGLRNWHRMLGLPQQATRFWHRDRLRKELREAPTPLLKLSESSDVFFSISRARYDGFAIRSLPSLAPPRHLLVYAYMLGKFTMRWAFYRTVAVLCKAPNRQMVNEVVNPGKNHKLFEVATRHNIDSKKFLRVGLLVRRVWPLLP
ncbi:uncharacterized protein K452DRAFT_230443 [Aplosporella prunicola CBS 121167]|uniref:Uncharacterized protein n=1 Tax=Aplosporella prunicola CBS 121167 TaxID=1176127 RepID=A0A6A6B8R9_9PEZI|nr:uncharacterized protein K452DRAFT_230443 [Aplosporella prunicola CBS 121167]KAF2140520.1 hypothetical protein K452DRAFT_230443 [Aplosporella prunicola CBS 121167]